MITIKNLNKFFNKGKENELHVINDVSLSLPEKGLVALFGKSGCGKTTLLNVIGGLDKYNSGDIIIDNVNMTSRNRDLIRNEKIGYIFQNYYLVANESVYRNVESALIIAGETDKESIGKKVTAALKSVGMENYARRAAADLSGGQQQRVAIARAIVKGPNIILADEPTGNLDESNTLLVMDILKEISKDRLVLLVTHEESIARKYCDEIIQIVDGTIDSQNTNELIQDNVIKNDKTVYLDDFEKHEENINGLKVEYYGDVIENASSIIIVSKDGKIFVKSNSNNVKFVNDNNEIKILQSRPETIEEHSNVSVEKFTPVVGKKKGRLFKFKDSFVSGLKLTFGKKKKGQKFLKWVFAVFSVALVVLSAGLGSVYYRLFGASVDANSNMVKVAVNAEEAKSIGQLNLGQASYVVTGNMFEKKMFEISVGRFESINDITITCESETVPLSCVDKASYNLVVGEKPLKLNEVAISSKLAKQILDKSKYSFIKKEEDLLGLPIAYSNYFDAVNNYVDNDFVIRAIYKCDDDEIYFIDDLCMNTQGLQLKVNDGGYIIEIVSKKMIDVTLPEIPSKSCIVYLPKELEGIINSGEKAVIQNYFDYDIVDSYKVMEVKNANEIDTPIIVLNNEDYSAYMYCYHLYKASLGHGFYGAGYMNIYESDSSKLLSIVDTLKSKGYECYVRQDYINLNKNENIDSVKSFLITIGAILLVMAISLLLVMRSNLFSKIKEVGVARAIGVNKGNIVYKFYVESIALVMLVAFITHLIASIVMFKICSISTIVYLTLYYPVWVWLLSMFVEFLIISIAAIVPSLILLRKTPIQILSKYDI